MGKKIKIRTFSFGSVWRISGYGFGLVTGMENFRIQDPDPYNNSHGSASLKKKLNKFMGIVKTCNFVKIRITNSIKNESRNPIVSANGGQSQQPLSNVFSYLASASSANIANS